MKLLHGFSLRLEARVSGVLYLASILLGVLGAMLISHKMQILGERSNLAAGVIYTGVTVLLWDLLRPAGERLSAAVAIFSLVANWVPESWYEIAHTTITLYFGTYCILIGCLILRSLFIPKYVGLFMMFAGACWLTTNWPWLANALSPYNQLGGLVGEAVLSGYLIVKGINERKWREQAGLL